MFGNASLPSMNYVYAARPPIGESFGAVCAQMLAGHRYRNKLVELERARRDATAKAMKDIHPEVLELEATADAAVAAYLAADTVMKADNAMKRNRQQTKAAKDNLASLRDAKKTAWANLKAAKKSAWADPLVTKATEVAEADYHAAHKSAYGESPAHWPTRSIHDQISLRSGAPPEFVRRTPPNFHAAGWTPDHWDGEGTIAVQLQKGLAVDDLMAGNDTRLQILPYDAAAWGRTPESAKRKVCKFRIGSTPDKRPIFATIPIVMHRPLPEGSRVKWAYLHRTRTGSHDEWKLRITVSSADGFPKRNVASAAAPIVGIDVGWRLVPGGLRVAYWSDGTVHDELVIPEEMLAGWRKVDELAGVRDDNFNLAIAALVEWKGKQSELPEWFADEASHVHQWRSKGKLCGLLHKWKANRIPGDDAIVSLLGNWRRHADEKGTHGERHLYDWQENLRSKLQRRREDIYRVFAAMLRRKYSLARVEDADWRKLAKSLDVDDDRPNIGEPRWYQRIASPGRLIEIIVEAMGGRSERVKAKDTTHTCHGCGTLANFDAGKHLFHTCEKCGKMWDQDFNAAENLRRAMTQGKPAKDVAA